MSESDTNHNRPGRFDLLVQKFLEQTIEAPEAGELLAMLECDSQLGREVLDHLAVHELLLVAARAERVTPMKEPLRKPKFRWVPWLAAAAALTMLLAVVMKDVFFQKGQIADRAVPDSVAEESTSAAVAVLGASYDAEWDAASPEPMVGSPLEPGILRLKKGVARIDFFNGARVVITGSTVFELVSQDHAICHSGKLSAEVPPQAHGFLVGTPDGDIRDLGTEFGLEVGADGAAVHVFDGEVEIEDDGPKTFRAGEGVRLNDGKMTDRFSSDRGAFLLSREALAERREALEAKAGEWVAAGEKWNLDPHLLARFDFTDLTSPAFALRNVSSFGEVNDGAVVTSPVVEGRWPGKTALQFRSLSDRVRLDIPGELDSLTFTAWVTVHSLPNRFNSLLMSDGFENGAVHWQIVEDGSANLGIRMNPEWPAKFVTPPLLTQAMFGQWMHLAVVVDGEAKTITHYLNGESVYSQKQEKLPTLRVGSACIGNWSDPVYDVPVRNLNGIIDEMTIHDRALGGEEIKKMYRVGSPTVSAERK